MNRDNIKKKTNAEENSSAILLSPVGANASQDNSKNSVQPAGDSVSEIFARIDRRKLEEKQKKQREKH